MMKPNKQLLSEVGMVAGFSLLPVPAGAMVLFRDTCGDGSSITSSTRTGVNRSANFPSLDTRTGSSTIGEFRVETFPEPSPVALIGPGVLALVRRCCETRR